MIATLPAVQFNCKRARCHMGYRGNSYPKAKRIANRRHRHALNASTRRFVRDPERFYAEGFNAPSLSGWDID